VIHAIRTDSLTKDYFVGFWRKRPHRALDALTLEVGAGEVFGFLGPNGAGKTTTLKLLMALIFPTSGSAEILGRPPGDIGMKRRIGFLPEQPYFYDYLTPEELLGYFAGLFGLGGDERRQRVPKLLDDVSVGSERRMPLRKLSRGTLQRVGIAQALLNDPEVLFLDEPMSGLDPLGRRDIRHLILRLRDQGRTVFFSSHILSDAEALCSRVAILARGRLVAGGPIGELLAFEIKGWEIVATGVTADQIRRLGAAVVRATSLGDDRFAIELTATCQPEHAVAALTAASGRVVSLNPIRETLEDFFVRRTGATDMRSSSREP
jgi:ABC-2 type transport system ATP-binding protein